MLPRVVFLSVIALGALVMALSVTLAPAPKSMLSAAEIERCSELGEAAGVGTIDAHTYCQRFGAGTMMKVWASRAQP